MCDVAFGCGIVIDAAFCLILDSVEFQWGMMHLSGKSGELHFAIRICTRLQIEMMKSTKTVCDVHLHSGVIHRFGVYA